MIDQMNLEKVKLLIKGMPRTFYGPEKFFKKYSEADASAF